MSKLLDLYDDCRRGQEVIDDLIFVPPKDASRDDLDVLTKTSQALEIFQKLILEVINEDFSGERAPGDG